MAVGDGDVVIFPASSHWKPEQAIAAAGKRKYDKVMIIGYDPDGNFSAIGSEMSCKDALWLSELLRDNALRGR